MIKAGQIYKKGTEKIVITNALGNMINVINKNGLVNYGYDEGIIAITFKLIAEYPTWIEAVNSKEFKGE